MCVKFLLKKNTHERRSVKEEASGLKMKTALARREATEKSRQRHSNRAKKDLLQRNPHISYEEWQKISRYAHLKPMKREEWTRAFSRCGKNSSVEEEEEKKEEEETRREDRDDIERFKSESNIASRSLASRKPLSSLQTHTNERTDTEENLRLFCSEIKTFDQFNRAWRDFEREEEKREKMLTFVFETDAQRRFWMKNTQIPLDMLFFTSDGSLVNIIHSAMPFSLTARDSAGPARYVLELNGGVAAEIGVQPDARLVLPLVGQ